MEVIEIIRSIAVEVEAFKKAGISISSLRTLISAIVRAVETLDNEYFKGKEKKEAALRILDEVYVASGIDIPFLPNSFERALLRLVAGFIIDMVVSQFNQKGW